MSVSKENLVHLESFLESFEDQAFNTPSQKIASHQQVKDILDSATAVNQELLDKLLKACSGDLKPDVEYLPSVLNTVLAILKKKENAIPLHVLPSAVAIVDIINAIATLKNIGALKIISLKVMCFETLLAYPDAALEFLVAQDHEEILKIFELYCSSVMTPECRVSAFQLLKRLLKILPPETRSKFVNAGVDIWFLKVVPTVVLSLAMNAACSLELLETLELLTNYLVHVDYADNKHWHLILECIYNPQKYPTVMKTLLENHNETWHRLWIILIRLLKEQITKVANKTGSPINSMLPIVEQAFKMDVESRTLAFKCWKVLIDNFSSEKNEAFVMKRLNLLTIPLKSPNAKVELTANAKINTWWHLIRKYHGHMGKLTNQVLLPFVQCCFGHPDKSTLVPGLLSPHLTAQCIEMLVEIFGHVNCAGCVTVPKLKSRLINLEILMKNWKEWLHVLKTAIKFSAMQESDGVTQQLSCLWQSLLLTIGELPDGDARSGMLSNLLNEIELLLKCHSVSEKLAENIYNVMIISIFNRDSESVLLLFKTTKVQENDPIVRILKVMLDPALKNVLSRKTTKDLKPITDMLLDTSLCPPNKMIEWLQQNLPDNENSIIIWSALTESISQSYFELNESVTRKLLMWPLMHQSLLVSYRSANVYINWKTLFNSWLNKTGCDKILSTLLASPTNTAAPAIDLKMCVALVLLKHLFLRKNYQGVESSTLALRNLLTTNIICYKDMENVFPMIVDVLSTILTRLTHEVNVVLAEKIMFILHLVMKLTMREELPSTDIKRYLLKPLNQMFKMNEYLELRRIIGDDIINYVSADKESIFKTNLLDILKTLLSKTKGIDTEFHAKVKAAIESAEKTSTVVAPKNMVEMLARAEPNAKIQDDITNAMSATSTEKVIAETKVDENGKSLSLDNSVSIIPKPAHKKNVTPKNKPEKIKKPKVDEIGSKVTLNENPTILENNDFATPNTEATKKSRKKEPTIVNTVVENGEEYAVVKSHWKFNPRKLTDHQKEKLKRKREDIPALYQDLSQSQDDMRLNTWKTDSQDTTTTLSKSNSNSTSNKDITSILKNIPSSNVVPKIMENILSDKEKNENVNDKNSNSKPVQRDEQPKVKTPKTPRMALKDRVFKNVRNLMEKSGLQDSSAISPDLIVDENLRTPPTKKQIISDKITYSAPSKICPDRPSRLIKKPKKFDDSELFASRKVRRSGSDSQSDSPVEPIIESSVVNGIEHASDVSPDLPVPSNTDVEDAQLSQISNMSNSAIEKAHTTKDTPLTSETVLKNTDDVNSEANVSKNVKDSTNPNTISKLSTPKPKNSKRLKVKSRIEKQLLIDMVEGHPFLKTPKQSTKRQISTKQRKSNDKQSNLKKQPKSKSKSEINEIVQCTSIDTNNKNPVTQKSIKKVVRTPNKKLQNCVESNKAASVTVMDSQNSQENLPSCTKQSEGEPLASALHPEEKSLISSVSLITSALSQDKSSTSTMSSQDLASSEDIIESSQDSTITTISVKSSKTVKPALPVNSNDLIKLKPHKTKKTSHTQDLMDQFDDDIICLSDFITDKTNDDIELPKNRTLAQDTTENNLTENMEIQPNNMTENMDTQPINLTENMDIQPNNLTENMDTQPNNTENMDTQPFDEKQMSDASDCEIINVEDSPIVIGTEIIAGTQSQKIAEADTEPFETENITHAQVHSNQNGCNKQQENHISNTHDDLTQTLPDNDTVSSPFKDEAQKNEEFLNNTIEISPIKTLSPIRDKKSPSPETSSEYVVIKLTSPVQSNGEPFNDKCDSPEIFTEDKTSPDKRNESPPREEVKATNTSPSSSLSLKKNRTKVSRGSGRAAQIMGLCAPEMTTVDIETFESDEPKKSPQSTQARRNLRIMYMQNSVNDTQEEQAEEDSEENFLKFVRPVPTAECSPSGPILKRKLAEITDETTVSPASKRKRVSFQDPPVSTTIAVHKYLEPGGMRSPQSSAAKRQERQARSYTCLRSQKRLDQIFKLDTVLTKAIESFSNEPTLPNTDSEMSSMEQTPAAEVVMTSELNNIDPICPELLDCNDPISNIAGELSSPAMKDLLIKELEGKVETVADIAKLTELEVNRLCIKAPKLKVAKQVLTAYATMRNFSLNETTFDATKNSNTSADKSSKYTDMEVQTIDTLTKDGEMQTTPTPVTCASSQTNIMHVLNVASQTNESGEKSTGDIVASCLADRADFVEQLEKQLREPDLQSVASNLSFEASLDLLMNKTNSTNRDTVIDRLLNDQGTVCPSDTISQFTDYLFTRFQSKDLILLCSKILQKVHDNGK